MTGADIYKDIATRTDGDIYIGVVGPVRTGKSTFIKRFMDSLVIPNIDNEYKAERARDELPQSAAGRTIMTTEPKFIPNEAVDIALDENAHMHVRMIDCVGYIVDSAMGYMEDGEPRMVQTPWFDHQIPFNEAAELGTKKVICDHSTIGLVVTTDGSITEIGRQDYVAAEERVIGELKQIGKPFVILLNSADPRGEAAQKLKEELEEKYGVSVMAVNCAELGAQDIHDIMERVLFEFPLCEITINTPRWIDGLDTTHWLKQNVYEAIMNATDGVRTIKDARMTTRSLEDCEFVKTSRIERVDLGQGSVSIDFYTPDDLFYTVLSELSGLEIQGEDALISMMCELSEVKKNYDKVSYALHEVSEKGYGIVSPTIDELRLEEPQIVRQGSRFGVKLKASAPSIHMIRADIETEVSPIVGSEKQSEELVSYLLSEFDSDPKKIWDSNIFGKSLHELVNEGLHNKLVHMPDDAQHKLQETLSRIINEGSGGLICIIL